MKLAECTWQDVRDFSREMVVVIPTGSLEQHGPHLPLFTDSLLATAVAEAVEAKLATEVLLSPTLWLGASGHHLAFPGSLSASFEGYEAALDSVIRSLVPHGFWKFYVLNGHGGNTEPNGIALRKLKAEFPHLLIGHGGYFAFIPESVMTEVMEGPIKHIRHACEAEASLALHLFPHLVRRDKLRDDGLAVEPPVMGLIHHFDELTEEGSLGFATLASAEKGKRLFDAAVSGVADELAQLAHGVGLSSMQ